MLKVEGTIVDIFSGEKGWLGLKLEDGNVYGGFDLDKYAKGDFVLLGYEQVVIRGKTYRNVKEAGLSQRTGVPPQQVEDHQPPTPQQVAAAQGIAQKAPALSTDLIALVTEELDLLSNTLSVIQGYKHFKDLTPELQMKYVVSACIGAKQRSRR